MNSVALVLNRIFRGKVIVSYPADERPSDLNDQVQTSVSDLVNSNASVASTALEAAAASALDEKSFPANAGLGDAFTQVTLGDGGYTRASIGECVGNLSELHGVRIMKLKCNTKTKLVSSRGVL